MTNKNKTEVIVLGTLHSQHLQAEHYGLGEVEAIIRSINPDVVLAEIPPDRFPIAQKQFDEDGKITEERVQAYPEFTKVVFPLQKELGFQLVPVSAWTEEMADEREEKLTEISRNPIRSDEWNTYLDAKENVSELLEASGFEFTPEWINSSKFDAILEEELSVFNRLFNDELGAGGWENINNAHYNLIKTALNSSGISGKKVLVIFGAGHKGWLRRRLQEEEEENIRLYDLIEVLQLTSIFRK